MINQQTVSALTATAHVATPKAGRYLKALCNHFDRKATASYHNNDGRIVFSFGTCDMQANDGILTMQVGADDQEQFERVKNVMAKHLIRFANKEALQVDWSDTQ